MVTRGRIYRSRALLTLCAAGLLAGSIGCGASQDSDRKNAFDDGASQEQAASAVPRTLGDMPSDYDEEAEPEAVEEPAAEGTDKELDTQDRLEAAIEAASKGDPERAKRDLRALTDDEEFGAYARYNLGVLAYADGDRNRAQKYIQEALDFDPKFGPAATAIVRQLLMEEKVAEAESFVREQLDKSDNASGIRAAALLVKLHKEDYQGVIADTRSILIDEPTNLDAHYALSVANLALGRVELAEYIMREARKRDDKRADIYFGLGKIALAEGNETEARRHWREALERNPNYPEAIVAISALDLKKMEYQDVVSALEPLVADVPEYVDAWLNYGSGLKGIGKTKEAKTAFETAIELDPRSEGAAFNMGILYLDINDFDDLEQKERMETALEWFQNYRDLAGQIDDDDPVTAYEKFAHMEIEVQEEFARQAKEEEERKRRRAEAEAEAAAKKEAGEDVDDSDDDDDWGDDDGWDDDGWDDDW